MKLTIKRPETTYDLCLDGELFAEFQEAENELKEARKMALADSRLNSPVKEIAKRIVALQEQMKAETVTFTLRGLPRKDWARMVAENPPREGNAVDKGYGANMDALMVEAIPACIVEVKKDGEVIDFDPTKDWDALAEEMTDAQYDDFAVKTVSVNRGRQEVPFSQAAYKLTQASDQT